jgi:F420-dependent oxidoreductase-like protein
MQFSIFTEPQQGASYHTLLRVARAAEACGFDGFFRSDHLAAIGAPDAASAADGTWGMPGPTDAWLTLAALARETDRIRLGTLMTAATFRLPGLLAVQVAQADAMSGGRVELGIGTGWYEAEHAAYGIPFPPLGERFSRLDEQLAILTGLWQTPVGKTFSYSGRHYQLTDSPALPKPVQSPHPPIVIGGGGKTRTPRLAAAYAAEFNMPFRRLPETREAFERVRAACAESGRDPASMTYSAALSVCCGRDDAEVDRRIAAIGRHAEELRTKGVVGTPERLADALGGYVEAGASRLHLRIWDLGDLDHIELLAAEVLPRLR